MGVGDVAWYSKHPVVIILIYGRGTGSQYQRARGDTAYFTGNVAALGVRGGATDWFWDTCLFAGQLVEW